MWVEARQFLALLGNGKVTIAAFAGLLVYGLLLSARKTTRNGLTRGLVILAGSLGWLVLVILGPVAGELGRWSSLAVFLFVVGVEGRSASQPSARAGSDRNYEYRKSGDEQERPPLLVTCRDSHV